MPNPGSRLARVLHWYEKQYQVEQSRTGICTEQLRGARRELDAHNVAVLAQRAEIVQTSQMQGWELASLSSFRVRARRIEAKLSKVCKEKERALSRQFAVTQKAHTRLRLIEKLQERRLAELKYETSRELETLASEGHLAAFARALSSETSP